tara:strand:- start:857 stop:1063 length:207 start_codon:yes stop_codon:yes gene_type:complete
MVALCWQPQKLKKIDLKSYNLRNKRVEVILLYEKTYLEKTIPFILHYDSYGIFRGKSLLGLLNYSSSS